MVKTQKKSDFAGLCLLAGRLGRCLRVQPKCFGAFRARGSSSLAIQASQVKSVHWCCAVRGDTSQGFLSCRCMKRDGRIREVEQLPAMMQEVFDQHNLCRCMHGGPIQASHAKCVHWCCEVRGDTSQCFPFLAAVFAVIKGRQDQGS